MAAPTTTLRDVASEFPVLRRTFDGHPLTYLDSSATSQTPQPVIDAMTRYYTESRASIHRGVYPLAVEATDLYEGARRRIADWLGSTPEETIFTANATAAMNLVAYTWGRGNVHRGDLVVLTEMEHHSNIVPWQLLCEEKGSRLRIAPVNDEGEVVLEEFEKLLSDRTKIVSFGHASNALGTINPIRKMIALAHAAGAITLIDGAQGVPHLHVDVRDLDCDFYAFSAHKVYGPTGTGVLYGKESILDEMPPWQGGGDMILSVSFEKTTYNALPYKFEAGTPNIEGVIGLASALDYVSAIGIDTIAAHEQDLLHYATKRLLEIDGLRIIGTAAEKASVISFVLEGVHPHDIGTILDEQGIAVRTGHHCAQPLMLRFNVPATGRASFAMYNTRDEADALIAGLHKVIEVFR